MKKLFFLFLVSSFSMLTPAQSLAYCNPTLYPTNGCNYINSVTTSGGITNIYPAVDSGYNNSGVSYFTSPSVSQNAGSSFTLSVQSQGYCVNFSFYYVWIDWDQNEVFDTSELMVNNVNCNNDLTNFTINVPSTAVSGTTRMRIICDGSGVGNMQPCSNYSANYSESEDYNVVIPTATSIPDVNILHSCSVFPNPTSGNTLINFTLSSATNVSINAVDMFGKCVKKMTSSSVDAGKHETTLNTSELSNGIYLLQICAGNQVVYRKIAVNK
ncbi:MAG TPA: GEVED domain-containing protein [Chitinophagales bacterium]|nr:GEVED domain-containing protein [Chitinophagales bacterium]